MRPVLLAVLLCAAMLLIAVQSWRGSRIAAGALLVLAGVWLLADKEFEGPELLMLVPKHGLVLADLVGLATAAFAGVCWVRAGRRPAAWSHG